jgi:transcriptional regulator with XRE-family HTH domain
MTLLEDAPTSALSRADQPGEIELVHGLLAGAVFGTSAGVALHQSLRYHVFGLTTVPAAEARDATVVADEVRRLRDDVCRRGLTRQDVARGIGVDRRSLSGYASGEINPQPERIEALRILARVTREIDAERPTRVREILLAGRGADTLLDAIASGRYAVAAAWRTWVARLEASVDVRPRTMRSEPVWSAAARALAEGRLAAPARAATVRPADVYEMDTAEATAFEEEPDAERRRPSYR